MENSLFLSLVTGMHACMHALICLQSCTSGVELWEFSSLWLQVYVHVRSRTLHCAHSRSSKRLTITEETIGTHNRVLWSKTASTLLTESNNIREAVWWRR